MSEPILSQRLTKRFLASLETGQYLVSNTQLPTGQPCFQEVVSPAEHREAQWRRIVAARISGNTCCVFARREDYLASRHCRTSPSTLN